MPSESRRKIIRPLTGLRGITVLSVMVMHFSGTISTLLPAIKEFVAFSNRIVFRMDLFFMLSGFILSYIHIASDQKLTLKAYREFLLNRLIRLYPSYLAVSLILITTVTVCRCLNIALVGDYPLNALPFRFLLLQSWPFLSWTKWTWNYPTWFLSALMFAYIAVFPCAWVLVQRLRGSRYAIFWVFGPLVSWVIFSHIAWLGEFHILLRASCEFICGAALYVLYLDRSRFVITAQKHLDMIALFFVLSVVAVSTIPIAGLPLIINTFLVLATPCLLAGLTAESSFVARMMSSRPALWVGKISYALFVSHALVQKAFKVLMPASDYVDSSLVVRCLILAIRVAGILTVALALHKLVELPCANALKVRIKKRVSEGQNTPHMQNSMESINSDNKRVPVE